MKLVDKMKDEQLGVALIYSFTKGYKKPVPMKVYDIVLPFVFHDTFREALGKCDSLNSSIQFCLKKNPDFKKEIYDNMETYESVTSKSLGLALVTKMVSFDVIDGEVCGRLLEANVLDFNEVIAFGSYMRDLEPQLLLAQLKKRTDKIVLLQTDSLGKDVDLSFFDDLGEVTYVSTCEQEEVIDHIKDADVVVTNKNIIGKKEMDACGHLKLICLFATGTNNVDLEYAKEKNIQVSNVKGYSTDTVAQHTIALAMHLIEKNAYYDRYVKSKQYVRDGNFTYFNEYFHDVSSMTWGIVGLGDIGKKVASIALAMGAKVQYYSTSGKNTNNEYQQVDLDTLLQTSDIISIHAPLTDATNHLFNLETMSQMKPQSYLINVGRGPIIDEVALVDLLNKGHFSGVGLDVFEQEPLSDDSVLYTIKDMDKVILTPHVAWGSVEARHRLVKEVYMNIEAFYQGEKRNKVND